MKACQINFSGFFPPPSQISIASFERNPEVWGKLGLANDLHFFSKQTFIYAFWVVLCLFVCLPFSADALGAAGLICVLACCPALRISCCPDFRVAFSAVLLRERPMTFPWRRPQACLPGSHRDSVRDHRVPMESIHDVGLTGLRE